MKIKFLNQLDFSTLLFDTLFGLVLFYSFDSLVSVSGFMNFIFYLFSMFIVIHWWLMFKSADDIFEEEVTDSATDLVIGIIEVILLDYIVIVSRSSIFTNAAYYLVGLFVIDIIWALIWRYVGEWRTKSDEKIKYMEKILKRNIFLDLLIISLLILLLIFTKLISAQAFLIVYIAIYLLYIAYTFIYKILDIDIF